MKRTVIIVLVLFLSAWTTACAGSAQVTWEAPPSPPHELILPIEPGNEQPISDRSPLDPIPGEDTMIRGPATVLEADLLTMESYPLQIRLNMKGNVPTPCHHLRATVHEPDAQNRIEVEVFSLSEPDVVCIQVLQAFESSISLGPYPDGRYTVWVNGEKMGEFTQ
ncbi:MAG: hypothetical protein PVF74_00755 [Anaerolineales bacterium]